MAKDRTNIRIYGDLSSSVWTAVSGTTPPVALGAPGVAYKEVGWISEDGVDLERAEDVAEFHAWQAGTLVRKKVTSVDETFRFQALEENLVTMGLYYKGQAPVVTTGVAKITVTNQAITDERAWLLRMFDGAVEKRYVIPSGEVTGRAAIPHRNSDMTIYEFTVSILGDYDIYTNAPAIIA